MTYTDRKPTAHGAPARWMRAVSCVLIALFVLSAATAQAQSRKKRRKAAQVEQTADPTRQSYHVSGGVVREAKPIRVIDSLLHEIVLPDSLTRGDSLSHADSLRLADSLALLLAPAAQRELTRELDIAEGKRRRGLFRDSISLSGVCALTAVMPGFAQIYNHQYWKLPILYGALGTTLGVGIAQSSNYRNYRNEYDRLLRTPGATRADIDPVQTRMIKLNTYRQLLFAGAAATWIYFIGDAAMHYDGERTSVKQATTLSTICPGAGQIYNKSYWKLPIVIGGFATFAYVIDFNSRGYNRFKLAYDLVTDGDDDTVDEFGGRYDGEFLRRYKQSYRRDRDLCILLTCAFYLFNIVDAHVDAHLKDYDVSDDLSMSLTPAYINLYAASNTPRFGGLGMSLNIRF